MKYMRKPSNLSINFNNKLLYIIFIWSFLLFMFHLNFSNNADITFTSFFISIIGMLGVVTIQILNEKKSNTSFIIIEILIINVCLHLIYQYGFSGLNGSDSYVDLKLLEAILTNNSFQLNQMVNVSNWPDLHLFSAFITFTSGLNYIVVAKYLPSFLTSFTILFIYLLSYQIYKNKEVALMACLIYVTIPKFMMFGSLFIREIFGTFAIISGFYFIYVSKTKDSRYIFLSLILLLLILFSHHFSSFIFLILILIFMIISVVLPLIMENQPIKLPRIQKYFSSIKKIKTANILILFFVSLLSYWLFSALEIWRNFVKFFSNLVNIGETPSYAETSGITSAVVSLKGYIMLYGTYSFFIIFSIILLIKIFRDYKTKTEDMTLTFFLFFCGLYGLLCTYVISSIILPDRLLTYGWLLGVIPLTAVILSMQKSKPLYRKLFVLILVSFMFFNIYNISSEYIIKDFTTLGLPNDREIAITNDIIFPDYYNKSNLRWQVSKKIYGYEGINSVILAKWKINIVDLFTLKNFTDPSQVAIINKKYILRNIENDQKKNPETYIQKVAILNLINEKTNKICDTGEVYILKP